MGELASLSNLALVAQGASGAASIANSVGQASALREQGRYAQTVAESNAAMANLEAKDAKLRGEAEKTRLLRRAGIIQGAQRARFAAQGIDPNEGSAAEVQADTAGMAAEDAQVILNNAYREGWGHRVEASNYLRGGRMARLASKNEANATLLTGGLQFGRDAAQGAYLYEKYKEPPGKKKSDDDYWTD